MTTIDKRQAFTDALAVLGEYENNMEEYHKNTVLEVAKTLNLDYVIAINGPTEFIRFVCVKERHLFNLHDVEFWSSDNIDARMREIQILPQEKIKLIQLFRLNLERVQGISGVNDEIKYQESKIFSGVEIK
jgi:hypothetical protein